eukprot:TRINITY_DN11966_c0_g1_i1.p2 TRINITY_DN11966_c0_g1~~TRINITY_DN11966_c0_g1_i1.p2  ORF type:complete len:284 (+),score=68.04 TRINITY_DN11966_c0_g1_i1:80-931(+)
MQGMADFVAGALAGAVDKLVEHPFDTVKVRVQTGFAPTAVAAARKTWHTEGPSGFYRGVGAPLSGAMFEAAISLCAYGRFQNIFRDPNSGDTQSLLEPWQYAAAGAGTGITSAFVLTPVELVKVRVQARATASNVRGALRSVLVRKGVRGLYAGASLTLLRDIPGNAALFGTYDGIVVSHFCRRFGCSRRELPAWVFPVAGAIGGAAYWMVSYPVDTVKSQMQLGGQTAAGAVRVLRLELRTGGLRGLYRGFGITVVRALPANATTFIAYEQARRHLYAYLSL